MFIVNEENEELYGRIRAQLGEHFPNFMFIVMDDAGDVYYDYTNRPVGKMLANEMLQECNNPMEEDDWIWDFEDNDISEDDSLWEDCDNG